MNDKNFVERVLKKVKIKEAEEVSIIQSPEPQKDVIESRLKAKFLQESGYVR